jgi:hypothetical protein
VGATAEREKWREGGRESERESERERERERERVREGGAGDWEEGRRGGGKRGQTARRKR